MATHLSVVVRGKVTLKTEKVSLYSSETLFYENPIGVKDAQFEFNFDEFNYFHSHLIYIKNMLFFFFFS